MAAKKAAPDADKLISLYATGQTLRKIIADTGWPKNRTLQLARDLGIIDRKRRFSDSATFRALKSRQTKEWWSKATAKQKAHQVAGAHSEESHKAIGRGNQKVWDSRTQEQRKQHMAITHQGFAHERDLIGFLADLAVSIRRQRRIGPYRVDLAIDDAMIAIEVCGNYAPGDRYRSVRADRTKYILDQGWLLAFILVGKGETVDVGAAKKIVALLKQSRRDPTIRGQYRVLRRNGKLVACGRAKDENFPFI